jgi:spore maturation protein CgeB
MTYHIAFGRVWNFETMAQDAASGQCPRHVISDLAQRLNAECHFPTVKPTVSDRLRSQIVNTPEQWAMARTLAERLTPNDVVYCTGEDVGVPLATYCDPDYLPRIVMFVHAGHTLRNRLALALGSVVDKIALFVTNCTSQVRFLQEVLGVESDRIYLLLEQTDTRFFSPGPAATKVRPMIASVGLELRDYRTLAAATADLDVDVRISGFSKDIKALAKSFPEQMPDNMDRRFYSWPDLTQLYRDADIVVVSLFAGEVTSGVTTLLEAMACQRPVIVSQTAGLSDYIDEPGTVTIVPVGDVQQLRSAIQSLLADPLQAEAQAEAGYRRIIRDHQPEPYIRTLMALLGATPSGTDVTPALDPVLELNYRPS